MPGHIGTDIVLNSQRVLGGGNAIEWNEDDLRRMLEVELFPELWNLRGAL